MSTSELEIERLNARIEALERENAELEAFAAVAAHELVEPLVMTEAFASMISGQLSGNGHADSRATLETLGRAMVRSRLLVESVLHEARSSAYPFDRRPVQVSRLVADCITLLGPEVKTREAHMIVEDLPDAVGDESMLHSVFTNLLVNALKYSPRLGATIRVAGVEETGGCRYFVDSEGPVIAEEDRARIFQSFQRGRDERRVRGAGLGLSICQRLVSRHGGEIGVEPVNGTGNRFYFTVPR